MSFRYLIVLLIGTKVVAENDVYLTDLYNNTIDDLNSYCESRVCVRKCCVQQQVIEYENRTCIDRPEELVNMDFNYDTFPIYDRHLDIYNMIQLNTTITKMFKLFVVHNFYRLYEVESYYITEDGVAMEYYPNRYREWRTFNFCIDYVYQSNETNNNEMTMFLVEDIFEETPNGDTYDRKLYSGIGLLVSCFFMVVALLVYALLPELRNLSTLVSIATIFTMLCTFLNFSIDNLVISQELLNCYIASILKYYLFISTFFWMTVNSYDQFRTFYRRLPMRIIRTAKRKRFACYCLVAWGFPLLMTIFVVVLDYVDLSAVPKLIKPALATEIDGCFFSSHFNEDHEKTLYLYTPILILIFTNLMLGAITSFNIWKDSQYFAQGASTNGRRDSAKSKPDKKFFWVYLKLTTLTGISWIFEIVINFMPNDLEWFKYIIDTYNMLFGVIIFYIFICNKTIFKLLCKKYLPLPMALKLGVKYHKEGSTRSTTATRKSSTTDNTEYSSVKFMPDNFEL